MRTRRIVAASATVWLTVVAAEISSGVGWIPRWPEWVDRLALDLISMATIVAIAVVSLRHALPYRLMQFGREVEQEAQRRLRADELPRDTEVTGDIRINSYN